MPLTEIVCGAPRFFPHAESLGLMAGIFANERHARGPVLGSWFCRVGYMQVQPAPVAEQDAA